MTHKIEDLSALESANLSDAGVDMEVEHPVDGGPLLIDGVPVVIRVLGKDSAAYRKHQLEFQRNRVSRSMRSGRGKLDFIMQPKERNEMLAVCTAGWSGLKLDGQEVMFSHDAAVALYERFPFIAEQVDAFIGERANFFLREC